MNTLRASLRLAGFFAWMTVLFLGRQLLRGRAWRRRLLKLWARATMRIAGIRLRVTGPAPQPPFICVSNHVSYVDIVLLASQLDAVFVAKRDADFRRIIACMDTIFVDREHHRDLPRAKAAIQAAYDRGDGVVIFAEGTSSSGESVLPLRSSLLGPRPTHYAAISYENPRVAWWGDMKFAGHFFDMLKVPVIEATLTFGPGPITAGNRKVLARRLHQAISKHMPWPTSNNSSATTFVVSNKA